MSRDFGPWQELRSSKGKLYFYNRVTQVSQWEKPTEWIEYEKGLKNQPVNGDTKSPSVISSRPSTSTQNNSSRSNYSHYNRDYDSRNERETSSSRTYCHDHYSSASTSNRYHSSQNSESFNKSASGSTNGHNHYSYGYKNKRPSSRSDTSCNRETYSRSESNNHRKSRDRALQAVSDDEEPSPPSKKSKPVIKVKSEPLDGAEMISDDDTPPITKLEERNEVQEQEVLQEIKKDVEYENRKEREKIIQTECEKEPEKEVEKEREKEERIKLMSDMELEGRLTESFLSKVRIPEIDDIDAELRRLTSKQRELEREGLDILKDKITVKQIFTTLQVERISIQLKSEFPNKQADELENSGFL